MTRDWFAEFAKNRERALSQYGATRATQATCDPEPQKSAVNATDRSVAQTEEPQATWATQSDPVAYVAQPLPAEGTPGETVSAEVICGVRSNVARVAPVAHKSNDQRAAFEERASIIAFDGEMPRDWAEGLAYLQSMPVPAGMRPNRWKQTVDNACRFTDRWATKASALGWTTLDIFGVDRIKPDGPLHTTGLIWLLGDNRIATVTRDAVIVETANGTRQSFRRRIDASDASRRVALWDLTDAGHGSL